MLAFWPVIFSKLSQDGAPCDSRHSNSCCKVCDDDIVVLVYTQQPSKGSYVRILYSTLIVARVTEMVSCIIKA